MRALCIRSVIQNKLVVMGWGVVTGLEGWWGVQDRRLSGYMAEIVALSCKDAKIGQSSQKAVFPTFSLFPVILALLTSLDAGGAPNSRQFHFITPLQSILKW